MTSKLLIPILFGVIWMLTVVTALDNGNFKDSQVITMPTEIAERNTSVGVLQWAFSYCCPQKSKSCCITPWLGPDFIFHNILTVSSEGRLESNCNGPPFNENELGANLHYMRVYWPSLRCTTDNVQYWRQLWEVYGRCSGLNQREWFELGIELFKPEFTVALDRRGVLPGGTYEAEKVKDALELAVGHKVEIRCNTNSETGERQLFEGLMCYCTADHKRRDCDSKNTPPPGDYECKGKIVLPRSPCKPHEPCNA